VLWGRAPRRVVDALVERAVASFGEQGGSDGARLEVAEALASGWSGAGDEEAAARLWRDETGRPLDPSLVGAEGLGRVHQALLAAAGEADGGPSARKRQGSYYTPEPLARTLALLGLEGAGADQPEDVLDLRVLDPAMGAGAILLALLGLLERRWIAQGGTGDLAAARRLLTARCLVGADRDPAAVHLARASLQRAARVPGRPPVPLPRLLVGDALLEVPEAGDPRGGTLLGAERAYLAAVDAGGADQAAAALVRAREERTAALDAEARSLHQDPDLQAVHWRAALPEVVARGGFDAVVGNPPYHRELDGRELFAAVRRSAMGVRARSKGDLWHFFAHLGLDLLRPGGRLAFVVPAYWLKASGAGPRALRERLRAEGGWRWLVDLSAVDPFREPDTSGRGVAGRHAVFVVERGGEPAPLALVRAGPGATLEGVAEVCAGGAAPAVTKAPIAPSAVHGVDGKVVAGLGLSGGQAALLSRLQGGALPPGWLLSEGVTANPERLSRRIVARVAAERGVDLGARGLEPGAPVFVVPADWPRGRGLSAAERALLLPWLAPNHVARLRAEPGKETPWLIHTTAETAPDPAAIPRLVEHLAAAREVMERRRETRRGARAWWQLHWPRRPELLRGPRCLIPRMTSWPAAAAVERDCGVGESVLVLVPTPESLPAATALLNALPFAAGLLLTGKRRGVGVDLARAAVARCPWPSDAELADAAASLASVGGDLREALDAGAEELGVAPLLAATAAATWLAARPDARAHAGPWWLHGDPDVRRVGRVLDAGAARALDLDLGGLRALVEATRPVGAP
jgi:hypothetical protein